MGGEFDRNPIAGSPQHRAQNMPREVHAEGSSAFVLPRPNARGHVIDVKKRRGGGQACTPSISLSFITALSGVVSTGRPVAFATCAAAGAMLYWASAIRSQ